MVILNIETSTNVCSASISKGGQVIFSRIDRTGASHARLLPVFVDELLKECNKEGLSLDAVALSKGPGSYTGLRIGTSTAKGLCYGLNIPLIAIDTLQILAAACPKQADDTLLCPMIDARRMEVYCAMFNSKLEKKGEVEAKMVDGDSFKDILAEKEVCFFGNGASKCKEVIQYKNAHFIDEVELDARYMGALAEKAYAERQFADVAYFDPFYLKEFQAAPSHIKGLK